MKFESIGLMPIDFETLEKIYKETKKMKYGQIEHFKVMTGKFINPNILQVIKIKKAVNTV